MGGNLGWVQRAGGEGAFVGGLVQEAVPGKGRVRRDYDARKAQEARLAVLPHAQAQEVFAKRHHPWCCVKPSNRIQAPHTEQGRQELTGTTRVRATRS